MKVKLNDIYRWSYTAKTLEKLNHGQNNGTTYWAVSRFCICKQRTNGEFYLEDTFGSYENRIFEIDQIDDKIELEYLGNFDDLIQIDEHNTIYYDDSDIVDITHGNSFRKEIYLKKDAKKSLNKVIRIMTSNIETLTRKIESAKYSLDKWKNDLAKLTEENLDNIYLYEEKY